MNRLKLFLLSLAIFSAVALFPLEVHAEFMPPVLPDLNGYNIPGFLMDVYSTQMIQQQGVGIQPSDLERLNQLINGRSVSSSMNNHYVDNALIDKPMQAFYDEYGNIVLQEDTYTVIGTSDLGNYAYVCDKSTGKILDTYDAYEELVSTLSAGGFNHPSLFPTSNAQQQENIRQAINESVDNNMIVFGDRMSAEDMETLARYDYYLTYQTNAFGYTVFVPNACTSNTVCEIQNCPYWEYSGSVPFGNNNEGYSWKPIIRTNDPSEVIYSTEGQWNYLNHESNSQYGYTFSYISNINVGSIPFWNGGYIDFHLPTQAEYIEYRTLADNAVYVQPATNNGETTNVYNYTYVTNDNTRPSPIINHNYDNRSDTNYYNYPVTNNVTYPDYSVSTNNFYETIYNYYTEPQIKDETEVDPEAIGNGVPILSNLQNRFPFSIPWDIANIFKGLEAEREAPVISGDIILPVIDYTWHVELDLSMYDDSAELLRKCILILFIVGLAVFSYSHHFGS